MKTGREAGAGAFAFLEINDGSCFESLQAMVTKEVAEAVGGLKRLAPTGTAVLVEGELAATPEGTKQARLCSLLLAFSRFFQCLPVSITCSVRFVSSASPLHRF